MPVIKPYASPAARALLAEGATQTELAARLGVSRRTVGMYLDGSVRVADARLRAALRAVTDDEGADRVLCLVPPAAVG